MNNLPAVAAPPATLTIQDIFYVLFRHKWRILICTVLGLAAAAAVDVLNPPPYQSESMLFIRYVKENSTPGMADSGERTTSPDMRGETIMQTEIEILSSLDLAAQVAEAVGPDKILSSVKDAKLRTRQNAAAAIRSNLTIEPLRGSSVINLVYKNSDPLIVQPVLTALVESYKKKHIEVHRGGGVIGDFLSQETDQLRSRLNQTEDDLRKARDKAGIVSLPDAQKFFASEKDLIEQQIMSTEAEIAERSATYTELAKVSPIAPKPAAGAPVAPAPTPVPPAAIATYRNLLNRLAGLERFQDQLLTEFTDQSPRVKEVHAQIAALDAQKQKLEQQYPQLTAAGVVAAPRSDGSASASPAPVLPGAIDLPAEAARLAGLQAKSKFLLKQLAQIKTAETNVGQLEGTISELQRQKDLDETNYRYYATHLEATRIDEALGAGRALNIAEIQSPTPPGIDFSKQRKLMAELAAGGLAAGLAWAILIEFYLDRTLRRSQDVERNLPVPLLLSLPDFGKKGLNRHVFHETLRDRMIAFFESKGLTHKPKLVAVTGVGRNSGVTTTAAGLARTLSETGDGNVLLVDMTQTQGSAEQFSKGKKIRDFEQLLSTRSSAQVQENLYVVGSEPNNDLLSRALPSRFSRLVPQLKASDFDYIIFDMPPVSQISITPRLAQFMDLVLLVVESEKTDRDIAKQAASLLSQSRTHVGVILNKTRSYVPARADLEFQGSR